MLVPIDNKPKRERDKLRKMTLAEYTKAPKYIRDRYDKERSKK